MENAEPVKPLAIRTDVDSHRAVLVPMVLVPMLVLFMPTPADLAPCSPPQGGGLLLESCASVPPARVSLGPPTRTMSQVTRNPPAQ